MSNRNYQIHFEPSFVEALERTNSNKRSAARLKEAEKYMHSLRHLPAWSDRPFSVFHFDPNGYIAVKGANGEENKIPAFSLVFINTSTTHMDSYLKGYKGINDQDMKRVIDPNGDGVFAPPIYASARNWGWSLLELLRHPDINPNPDPRKIQYDDYTTGNGANKGIMTLQLTRSYADSPLEMLAMQYDKLQHDSRDVLMGRSVNKKDLDTHYNYAIVAMVNAGAVVTSKVRKGVFGYPEFSKLLEMEAHAKELSENPPEELALADMKHMHAFGTLRTLFMKADTDDALSEKLFAVRDQLPPWLEVEYSSAYSILSSWANDIRAENSKPRGGRA